MNVYYYDSPLGGIILSSDGRGLTGLHFEGQKHFDAAALVDMVKQCDPVIDFTVKWLDIYFRGKKPDFTPPLSLHGTEFRLEVWNMLLSIPYGDVTSYGSIAKKLAEQRGIVRLSSRAVGSAVGHNPVSIIVPCHRVIGSDGSLTGYAGGIERKKYLLQLENKI